MALHTFFMAVWFFGFALQAFGRARSLLIFCSLFIAIRGFICTSPYFLSKIFDAINEISSYQWSTRSTEGYTDIRPSFYRMAVFYFLQNPYKAGATWGGKLSRTHQKLCFTHLNMLVNFLSTDFIMKFSPMPYALVYGALQVAWHSFYARSFGQFGHCANTQVRIRDI